MTKITYDHIKSLMDSAEYQDFKAFDSTTVVIARFPNGWTMVESSSCIDPKNYDHELGIKIAKENIESKLWQLEGYLAMNTLQGENNG